MNHGNRGNRSAPDAIGERVRGFVGAAKAMARSSPAISAQVLSQASSLVASAVPTMDQTRTKDGRTKHSVAAAAVLEATLAAATATEKAEQARKLAQEALRAPAVKEISKIMNADQVAVLRFKTTLKPADLGGVAATVRDFWSTYWATCENDTREAAPPDYPIISCDAGHAPVSLTTQMDDMEVARNVVEDMISGLEKDVLSLRGSKGWICKVPAFHVGSRMAVPASLDVAYTVFFPISTWRTAWKMRDGEFMHAEPMHNIILGSPKTELFLDVCATHVPESALEEESSVVQLNLGEAMAVARNVPFLLCPNYGGDLYYLVHFLYEGDGPNTVESFKTVEILNASKNK
jgi:hypothetical protein